MLVRCQWCVCVCVTYVHMLYGSEYFLRRYSTGPKTLRLDLQGSVKHVNNQWKSRWPSFNRFNQEQYDEPQENHCLSSQKGMPRLPRMESPPIVFWPWHLCLCQLWRPLNWVQPTLKVVTLHKPHQIDITCTAVSSFKLRIKCHNSNCPVLWTVFLAWSTSSAIIQ